MIQSCKQSKFNLMCTNDLITYTHDIITADQTAFLSDIQHYTSLTSIQAESMGDSKRNDKKDN